MDAMRIGGADASKLRGHPFRVEVGDGSEPPRLIVEFSRFMVEEGQNERVAQLEAKVAALVSTISALQSQIDTLRG